ncbi:hypothetical protein ABE61_16795 [Lysinibacillus sphaericus]|uniref:hypothetical protein n=1 Tax=Lysinibacillus sphaericus TaxID=1421 RepID=UPI0018CF97DD|nr:hypothetical protein [Lysinibacillus sphaericus]MBG9455675.1 hypothetical protein [Lysinibacillus sphaericus]MBG9479093.1 hypothetical protein [Lysinibacillus sphaericus]MBG9591277.1 hypothetical protein [Lysinibacillus sphaericus]
MKKSMFRILFVILFLLSACTNAKTQTLEKFYKDAKIETVDKAIIQDGSTGYSKTITKQEQIGELLNLIKDIEFTPLDNQEERTGWRYGIALFDGEKEIIFTLSEIDDIYYDSKPDIYPIVENYYKQLDIEEK